MNRPTVERRFDELAALLDTAFARAGMSVEDAATCRNEILEAEWTGKASFGLQLVPHVVAWNARRRHDPKVVSRRGASAFVEGGDCPGPIAAAFAMALALEIAAESGIALVGARNRWPWIVAGHHLRRAANAGFIAITGSAGVPIVAPYGGLSPVFGTNPFAIAAPAENGPIVFDTAITAGPAAVLRDAKRDGVLLAEGIALDSAGVPTRDPEAARNGALLPFAGHRGSGLGLMIELLGGAWVGAKTGASRKGSRGFFYFLAHVDQFGFGEEFPGRAEGLVKEILDSFGPGSPGRIPGRPAPDFTGARAVETEALDAIAALAGGA